LSCTPSQAPPELSLRQRATKHASEATAGVRPLKRQPKYIEISTAVAEIAGKTGELAAVL
jgi:hypothetical protein